MLSWVQIFLPSHLMNDITKKIHYQKYITAIHQRKEEHIVTPKTLRNYVESRGEISVF